MTRLTVGDPAPLFELPDVDGALVGGASLDADEFARLCRLGRD
jgi:triosephosphate isomerase